MMTLYGHNVCLRYWFFRYYSDQKRASLKTALLFVRYTNHPSIIEQGEGDVRVFFSLSGNKWRFVIEQDVSILFYALYTHIRGKLDSISKPTSFSYLQ